MMAKARKAPAAALDSKRDETAAFVFLAVLLAPAISVIVVGGYGFVVWMSQLLFGPPGA